MMEVCKHDPRWFIHGWHNADAEIALWCNKGLRELTECTHCEQTGEGPWQDRIILRNKQGEVYDYVCKWCVGLGRFWDRGVK